MTGFCGYGDQCKFLHDRGDYKSGWQLEREWDAEQSKKKKRLESAAAKLIAEGMKYIKLQRILSKYLGLFLLHCKDEDADTGLGGADGEDEEENFEIPDEEELPFACFICREPFKNPVMTLCGHYFCSDCIIAATKKKAHCPACDKQTFGVFNRPHKLLKKMQQLGGSDAAKALVGGTNTHSAGKRRVFGDWESTSGDANSPII